MFLYKSHKARHERTIKNTSQIYAFKCPKYVPVYKILYLQLLICYHTYTNNAAQSLKKQFT